MKSKSSVVTFIGVLSTFLMVQGGNVVLAEDPAYPSKSISFYIPFGAGGTTDAVFRPLLEAVSKELGQQVIPINKPGSGGAVSVATVMNSKPDGYTLGACTGGNIYLAPHVKDSPYKDLSGLTFIMNYVKYVHYCLVRSDFPPKTWNDFIEWAKKNPKATKIGTPGGRSQNGSAMTLWRVEQKENVEFTFMPFKGASESQNALLGGHITMDSTGLTPTMVPYLKEGKVRILAYLGDTKIPGFENIPTFPQLYGFAVPDMVGVIGPAGLPTYVLDKLEQAFARAVKDPGVIKALESFYVPVVYLNKKEFTQEVNKTFNEIRDIVKQLGDQ